ncbi:PAS domain S-box protein (plasmid) [Lichenicola cladoniae]|uniref:histidine kinase n=1 Tax=Lichenicola cladoniae TaxID=1484109 RepID=A0A6M8HZ75_9PROT|nr:ATP-binding protein [Lichenicola cladoniae]NPD70036.1 PAS domain S-box protein [Acetobacteraceae bacterium]QKE93391.1 PAS domain S-box protein [Lichenicola cladoniae]
MKSTRRVIHSSLVPETVQLLGVDCDVFDLMQESVIAFDANGRISFWNAASERIYGWQRADTVGRLFQEVLGDQPWQVDDTSGNASDNGACSKEIHRRTLCGREVVIQANLAIQSKSAGRAQRIIEIGLDVTVQRQAELEARVAQRQYRNVFQAVAASAWEIDFTAVRVLVLGWLKSIDEDPRQWLKARPALVRELIRATIVTDVNDRGIQLFRASNREQLLGSIDRYWPEASTDDFCEWIASALAGETFFSRETRQRRHDGVEFDALFTASFAPGATEDDRLVVTIVDYSDIKRGQAAVRESEAFYTDMFHGAAFSAWHLDATETQAIYSGLRARGVTDFRAYVAENPELVFQIMEAIKVVDVNETSVRLFGAISRGQMIGQSVTPYWLPDRLETFIGSLDASFRGCPTFESLGRMRTLAGNEIDVLFTRSASSTLRNAGQLLLAIVDMTDKVNAQNALAEMQATFAHAARVSSLGELTASIAHEINQPLAAIAANGEAASRWLAHPVPDLGRLRGLSEDIIADARRASDVVGHIRSMASPQVGQYRPVSLNSLVGDALTLLSSQLNKVGVQATCDFQPDLPNVLGDPVQLQQVIVNLILNAIQAMEATPCRRLSLNTVLQGDHVSLTVIDTGLGIRTENLGKLFGSFFTTKTDGMGIGLAICRTIVEAHGGTIVAVNCAPRGASFTVRLPAQ